VPPRTSAAASVPKPAAMNIQAPRWKNWTGWNREKGLARHDAGTRSGRNGWPAIMTMVPKSATAVMTSRAVQSNGGTAVPGGATIPLTAPVATSAPRTHAQATW
jgi:hypothetical protein